MIIACTLPPVMLVDLTPNGAMHRLKHNSPHIPPTHLEGDEACFVVIVARQILKQHHLTHAVALARGAAELEGSMHSVWLNIGGRGQGVCD